MFGDGNNVGPCDFSNGDTTIRLVGSVEVDMVGADTSRDCEFEILSLSEAFGG